MASHRTFGNGRRPGFTPPSSVPRSLTLRTARSTHVNGSADLVSMLADPYTRTGIRGRPARPPGSRCAPDRSLARLSSRAGAGRNTRGNLPARCYGGRAAAPRRRAAEILCEEVSEPQVEQQWQDQLGLELRVAGRPGGPAGAGLFAVGAEVVNYSMLFNLTISRSRCAARSGRSPPGCESGPRRAFWP